MKFYRGLLWLVCIFTDTALFADFRGEQKNIPLPEKFHSQWKSASGLLDAVPRKNGVLFSYRGSSQQAVQAFSPVLSVKPGMYLQLDYNFFKHKWNYGSVAPFFVELLNSKRQVIQRIFIDRTNITPELYRPTDFSELGYMSGIGLDLHYFNYIRIPAKTAFIRLAADFAGNPSVLELKSWKITPVDPQRKPWFRQPPKGEQLVFDKSPAVSDAEAWEILKKRPKCDSRLVRNKDRVEWYINGKKILPAIFHNSTIGSYARLTKIHPAGFRLITTPVMLGRSGYKHQMPPVWKEDGSFDLEVLENAVLRVIREAPEAYVILNIIVTPTAKWLKENQSELHLLSDGTPGIIRGFHFQNFGSRMFPDQPGDSWSPSVFSKKYRNDISAILENLMRKFDKTPAANAVAGVYITGGDDIQFRGSLEPDHSPLAVQAFRKFLKNKYKTSHALSRAWRQKGITFDRVKMPSKERLNHSGRSVFASGPCLESDYIEFYSQECADLKTALRRAVKRGAPRLLSGGYDGAPGLSGSAMFGLGRLAYAQLLASPETDFLISLPFYGRERDECTLPLGMDAYNGSLRLHKKLMISEMDIRNPEQPPLQGWNKSRNWQALHNHWTFSQFLKLYGGYAVAWGGGFHAFPLGNRTFYDTPKALDAWKNVITIASAAKGETPGDDRISWINSDRCVDIYPPSPEGGIASGNKARNINTALWLSQIRFDVYLAEDLFHPDFKAPKIMLLGDLSPVQPEMIAKIRKRFLKEGRVLIWLGAPGILSGASLDELSKALGFQLSMPDAVRHKHIFIDRSGDPLLAGVSGFLMTGRYHTPLTPYFNASASAPDAKVLGYFQGTEHPGVLCRTSRQGTEIFIGQQGAITPQFLRNIARRVNIAPITSGNDLMIRGGGLIVLGASTGNGVRKIHYPAGVKKLKCLTGQKIENETNHSLEVYLKYGECAVFQCCSKP